MVGAFSNSAVVGYGNLRGGPDGASMRPGPEMRVRAHFSLDRASHYKKTRQSKPMPPTPPPTIRQQKNVPGAAKNMLDPLTNL